MRIFLEQLLDGEVHTITPIVARISRDVDALSILVGQTKTLVDREPVLKRQQTEH